MPKRQPGYLHYKEKNLARVILNGKPIYLGKYDSPESWEKYYQVLAEWNATKSAKSVSQSADAEAKPLTIFELCDAFESYGVQYYGDDVNGPMVGYRAMMKHLTEIFGSLPANEFQPVNLIAYQDHLISKGLTRKYVNMQTTRLKHLFKWSVPRGLVPAPNHHALTTVPGVAKGRRGVRNGKKVKPVPDANINAALEHLTPVLRAMVMVQRLTGARPGEICQMRPCDIDRGADVWFYTPGRHKTENHDIPRTIPIGPRAQAWLTPFLRRDANVPCFSPIESESQRLEARQENRKTPARKETRRRGPRNDLQPLYSSSSYRKAIERACKRAKVPKWSPNQLRHSRATELRQKAGYEVARTTLGHRTDITEIYAERDLTSAAEAARKFG